MKGEPWTEEQIKALKDNWKRMSDTKLEPLTEHNKDSNSAKRHELGLFKYRDDGVYARIIKTQEKAGFLGAD